MRVQILACVCVSRLSEARARSDLSETRIEEDCRDKQEFERADPIKSGWVHSRVNYLPEFRTISMRGGIEGLARAGRMTGRTEMTDRWGMNVLRAGATALMLAAIPVMASAQSFAPVAVVNDEVITTYDVDQRMRLIKAAGAPESASVLREAALDELINDRLRLQAARRGGIVPSPDQIRVGFDEISSQNKRDPDEMRRYFVAQGVSPEALNAQIAPEVAWRRLIRQRYMPRIRISDSELDDALDNARAGDELQYLLAEIRIPIDQSGEAATLQRARGVLEQLVRTGEFAATARQLSDGPTASIGGDLGWVSASALSSEAQAIVSKLSADRVSAPFVEGSNVVIYGLRGIRGAGAMRPGKFRLSQLVVGVSPNAPQAEADAAFQRAQLTRAQVTDCASIEALKPGYLPISGDLGELSFSEMPGAVREAVASLNVGDVSPPVRSNDGFHVIIVCDKTETDDGSPELNERAREALVARKLARYARGYLKELRRDAVIEMR